MNDDLWKWTQGDLPGMSMMDACPTTLETNFANELQELAQDMAVVEAFGFAKLEQGVQWVEAVETVDDLPFQVAPNTCCYVEDEESAYMWDGCGWVMFMAPSTVTVSLDADDGKAVSFMYGDDLIAELQAQLEGQEAWTRMVEQLKPTRTGPRVLSSRRR